MGSWFLFSKGTGTFTELGSIIHRHLQRNSLFEVSGSSARDGSSRRRVVESTQREKKLKRASRARNRPLAHFRPGDEVNFWRRGKGKGARPHIKGRFHRGAAVLATSTEIDEEDGSRSRERSSGSLTREL